MTHSSPPPSSPPLPPSPPRLFLLLLLLLSLLPFPPSAGAQPPQTLAMQASLNKNSFAQSLLEKSVCFKRVPVPHFFLKGYTLPGSAFVNPKECSLEDEASNQIRTSLSSQPGGDYRLPDALHPLHYTLKLCPRLREPFDFDGTVQIDLQVQTPTSEVTLNMLGLEIKSVSLWYLDGSTGTEEEGLVHFRPSTNKTMNRRKNSKFKDFRRFNTPSVSNGATTFKISTLSAPTSRPSFFNLSALRAPFLEAASLDAHSFKSSFLRPPNFRSSYSQRSKDSNFKEPVPRISTLGSKPFKASIFRSKKFEELSIRPSIFDRMTHQASAASKSGHFSNFIPESKKVPSKNGKKKVSIAIKSIKIDKKLQRVTITTKEELKANKEYKLKIVYSGFASNELTGLYKTHHYDIGLEKRYSLVTQFQVSEARKVFPCFDEPGFKSSFSIIICREISHQTISNMPKIATVKRKHHPGMVWDMFQPSLPMPTYLVAFAILQDFEFVQCNHSLLPFKVWAPSTKIQSTDFACDVSPQLLNFFENYFQLAYPLPKMDLIALPQFFALGMENWGLVTFLWDRLIVDADSPMLTKDKQDALETISHEMVHQWFGNLVTPSWWSDIWLNEGFATFLSLLGVDYIRPQWHKMEEYVVDVLHNVLATDSMESSHPIVVNVQHPKDFFSIFDEISYGKGCFIVRMMMYILTERAFQIGLQTYLKNLEYKSASQDDLWHYMTKAGHEAGTLMKNLSIAEIMDTWVLQEGYPVVTVSNIGGGNFVVNQRRYYLELDEEITASERNGQNSSNWWIPISFISQQNANISDNSPKYWMSSYTHEIQFDGPLPSTDWYLMNIQQTGFYRVNYDRKNWILLIDQLHENHLVFDDITRAQILDDCFSLAYSDLLGYDIPLRMVPYLKKETSPYVIKVFMKSMIPLFESFAHDAIYGEFKKLIVSTLSGHFPPNGIFKRSDGLPFAKETLNILIKSLCKVHDPCIQEAKELFVQWTKDPEDYSLMDEELIETALCIAVSEGGEKEWEFIWNQFAENPLGIHQEQLIGALACTRHLWLSSRLLVALTLKRKTFMSKIYLPTAMMKIASNPVTVHLAFDFLQYLWPKIENSLMQQIYFEAVVPHLRSKGQLNELISFVSTSIIGKTEMPLTFVEEVTKNLNRKIEFQHRNYEEIFECFLNMSPYKDTISFSVSRSLI